MRFKYNLWLITTPFFLLAILSVIHWLFTVNQRIDLMFKPDLQPKPITKNYIYFSNLNGQGVETVDQISPWVVAAMIDNHPDAIHVGLEKAIIVYEVPVEGSATRFMAIYNKNNLVNKVGPIRSARPYFLDWASEYGNMLYLHSGGSPESLQLLKNSYENVYNGDEFAFSNYFWRDNQYYAPHNLFTSSSKYNALFDYYGLNKQIQKWSGWNYDGKIHAVSYQPVNQIKISYANWNVVEWKYDFDSQQYYRYLNNGQDKIIADNILVQFVSMYVIDNEGRLKLTTLGSGESRVLRNGQIVGGTWRKKSVLERTIFYDESAGEVYLKPGITWVMIIPNWLKLEVGN